AYEPFLPAVARDRRPWQDLRGRRPSSRPPRALATTSKGNSMPQRVRKAVLPVAGLGTRFLPATKVIPKEMIPVIDKPVVQYAVEEARAAGIEHFIFVSAEGKEAIPHHFSPQPHLEKQLAEKNKSA